MTFPVRSLHSLALIAAVLFLSSCAETQLISHWAKKVSWPGQEEAKGTYKIGHPYKVGSVWYYPQENFDLVETGIASWYGPGFHDGQTANGEIFDQGELTAAHRTLQLPCLVSVTNLENGRAVVVRVNDRGPYKNGRVMDVSQRAAELLGFANKGTARVRIQVLEKESRILASAAMNGEDTTRLTYDDLHDRVPAEPAVSEAPQTASAADTLPESLHTPTITVEELKTRGREADVLPEPAPVQAQTLAAGHMHAGHFMPDAVVTTVPVQPTGIFVQAGSFSVYDNAERLAKLLIAIAPTNIEPVTVSSGKMYRVRLGPLASVDEADRVLAKVIRAGQGTARIMKGKKA
jgi:rare lipoprotein A